MNGMIDRLDQGKKIAAASAIVLFGCMFLSWFNFSFVSYDAWESLNFISPILTVAIVATVAIALAEATDTDIGDINGGLVIFIVGCLAALLIFYRLVNPISIPGIGVDGAAASGSVEAGAFLALVASLGIVAGGYLATDGQAVERLKAMMPSGGSVPSTGAPASAAPPAPVAPPPKPRSVPPKPAPVAEEVVEPEPEAVAEPEPAVEPEPKPTAEPEAAVVAPEQAVCQSCGEPIRGDGRFCRKCGAEQTT
jgi:hypothetical protein